jgi:hypothetical protein
VVRQADEPCGSRDHLEKFWSPTQISNTLKLDHPDNPTMRASPQTIYEAVYRGLVDAKLQTCLRIRRRRRVPRHRGKKSGPGRVWVRSGPGIKAKRSLGTRTSPQRQVLTCSSVIGRVCGSAEQTRTPPDYFVSGGRGRQTSTPSSWARCAEYKPRSMLGLERPSNGSRQPGPSNSRSVEADGAPSSVER